MNGNSFLKMLSSQPTSKFGVSKSQSLSILLIGGGDISSIGGVVKFFADFSAYLVDKSYSVSILGNTQDEEEPLWFYEYHPKVLKHAISYRKLKKDPNPLLSFVAERKPDVIVLKFSNRPITTILKIFKENNVNIPIIRAEHGNVDDLVNNIWSKKANKRLATFLPATRIHFLGKNFLESSNFSLDLACKTFTCSSPVYPKEVKTKPVKKRNIFLFAGRLERYEKNAPFAVKVFLNVAKKLPNWDLHIIGDGSAKPQMQTMVEAAPEFVDRVVFHGALSGERLEQGYRTADVFLMPSDVEGAPVGLGEALACGVPAIGFAYCTGVNERIIDNVNGFLVDNAKDFERKMFVLADDVVIRQRFAKAAPKISETYNHEKIFQQWIINFHLANWFGKNELNKSSQRREKLLVLHPVLGDQLNYNANINLRQLSIIVPYFNMEEQFSLTIKQFNKAAEAGAKIFIIDDGSSKPFGKTSFVKNLHPTIQYISTFNFGVAAARNLGLALTTTDYVMFFDADDTLCLNNLNKALAFLKRSNLDFITLQFAHAIHKNKKITIKLKPKYKALINSKTSEEILKIFCPQIDASSCNKIFCTKFLKENFLTFPSQYRLEDVMFNSLCYGHAKRVGICNLAIGYYNKFVDIQGRGGATSWNCEKLKDALYVFNWLDSFQSTTKSKIYNGVYFLVINQIWKDHRQEMKDKFPRNIDELTRISERIDKYGKRYSNNNLISYLFKGSEHPSWVNIRYAEAAPQKIAKRQLKRKFKTLLSAFLNFSQLLREKFNRYSNR